MLRKLNLVVTVLIVTICSIKFLFLFFINKNNKVSIFIHLFFVLWKLNFFFSRTYDKHNLTTFHLSRPQVVKRVKTSLLLLHASRWMRRWNGRGSEVKPFVSRSFTSLYANTNGGPGPYLWSWPGVNHKGNEVILHGIPVFISKLLLLSHFPPSPLQGKSWSVLLGPA